MLNLRGFLTKREADPGQGIRQIAPTLASISLRSLMTSLRIIHISDLHFTDHAHTLDAGVFGPIDNQNSPLRSDTLARFLIAQKDRLDSEHVVITGDLTDSGSIEDYEIAKRFIQRLSDAGFQVHVLPGNHDYCWEGLLVLEDIFAAVRAITEAEIAAAIAAGLLVGILPEMAIGTLIFGVVTAKLAALSSVFIFPPEFVTAVAALFSFNGIIEGSTDTVDNATRRRRFIDKISHDATYPQVVALPSVALPKGYLILLDSMRDEMERQDGPRDMFAQGRLGSVQRAALTNLLARYQPERQEGKKIVVCLHHSPFLTEGPSELVDAQPLLDSISGKVDACLFGHTSPEEKGFFQVPSLDADDDISKIIKSVQESRGIPLINCENLEHVAENGSYPVTVLDLYTYERTIFFTGGETTTRSWGKPPILA